MTLEELKEYIEIAAKEHHEDEDEDAYYFIEYDVTMNIAQYCMDKKYEVKGFPFKQLAMFENNSELTEEDHEEFFTLEKYEHYIVCLSLEKEDVAELYWHYTETFWPGSSENREDFFNFLKSDIENDPVDFDGYSI